MISQCMEITQSRKKDFKDVPKSRNMYIFYTPIRAAVNFIIIHK